ncbi:hypothetical protein TYRP_012102 [Tyrophagus putrescentiae]|nr:hypothetical protein TYRP_012102 [Tyrophagus putrescentiae]
MCSFLSFLTLISSSRSSIRCNFLVPCILLGSLAVSTLRQCGGLSEDFEPCYRLLPAAVDQATQHFLPSDPDRPLVRLCSQLDSTVHCLMRVRRRKRNTRCSTRSHHHQSLTTTFLQFTLLAPLQKHLEGSVCSSRESRFRFRRRLLCYTSPAMGKLLQAEWWPRIIALAVSSLRHHLSGACGPREGLVDLDGLYSKTLWVVVSMACGPFRSFEELMLHLPDDLRERIERILAGNLNTKINNNNMTSL